jgi:hypothetical protein
VSDRLIFKLKSSHGFVNGSAYTDADLIEIPMQTTVLSLELAKVGDASIACIPNLPQLVCLDLDGTRITDTAIPLLYKFPALRELWLEQTVITDDGFIRLGVLRSLEFVSVVDTEVTQYGVEKLKSLLPKIEISV